MDAVLNSEMKTIISEMESNNDMVRDMVLDSFEEMKEGKGRRASDFFDELESRYTNVKV